MNLDDAGRPKLIAIRETDQAGRPGPQPGLVFNQVAECRAAAASSVDRERGRGRVDAGSRPRRGGGQLQAEDDAERGRRRCTVSAVFRSTASATAPSTTAAIPPMPIARPTERPDAMPDVPRQIELAQHHRHAERADDADADQHQREHAGDAADVDEDEDQRREQRLRDDERPAEADPVGDRAEQRAFPTAPASSIRKSSRFPSAFECPSEYDPERDEREQREPGDAAQRDHDAEQRHRPSPVVPAVERRAGVAGVSRDSCGMTRTSASDGERATGTIATSPPTSPSQTTSCPVTNAPSA